MIDQHMYQSADSRFALLDRARNSDAQRVGQEILRSVRFAIQGGNGALTNRYWEALTIFLPQCIYQNPRINVQSLLGGEDASAAVGLKYAIETMWDRQGWLSLTQQVAADALAWRGVIEATYDPSAAYPRYMEGQTFLTWKGEKMKVDRAATMTMPRLHYIPPDAFFVDPDATLIEEARYMGHCWDEDLGFIHAQADEDPESWEKDAIADLRTMGDSGKVKLAQLYVPHFVDPRAVAGYDGDEDPEDRKLYSGTIYTMLADGQRAYRDIRPPRLYRGPAGGLYSVASCVPTPGGGARLSPFGAAWEQVNLDARVSSALVRSAESYKRIVAATEQIGEALRGAVNEGVVDVEVAGELLQQSFAEISIGGPSKELMEAAQMADMACDRTLGMSDTLRQTVSSDETATAENLANAAYNSRTGLYANPIFDAVEQALSTVGWYIEHSEDFTMLLPPNAAEEGLEAMKRSGLEVRQGIADEMGQVPRVVYRGGDALKVADDGTYPNAFDGKAVKLVPMSSSRTNEGLQQKRVADSGNLLAQAVNVKAAFPDFDMTRYLNDQGSKMNNDGLGDYFPPQSSPQTAEEAGSVDGQAQDPMRQMAQNGVR